MDKRRRGTTANIESREDLLVVESKVARGSSTICPRKSTERREKVRIISPFEATHTGL